MTDLLDEARQMPDAAKRFARGVSSVHTPDHLVPLRTMVRERHRAELLAVHAALEERFDRTSDDFLNVFRAASEMALMEAVARDQLPPNDRAALRDLWQTLLNCR